MQTRLLLLVGILVLPALSGCFGDARSEWAYEQTQLNSLSGTGVGIRVAILDTGINVGHPSLDHLVDGERDNGEVVAFRDYLNDQSGVDKAYDADGHGSHVAGIISGRGSSFRDKLVYGGVDLQGGAPSVQLVVARVCDHSACNPNAIQQAIQWSITQNVHVLSLSLGGASSLLSFEDDSIRNAVQAALNAGVVVVAAAGNGGPQSDNPQNDVAMPADVPGVIAVGATDEDGRVSPISSRGDNDGQNGCQDLIVHKTGRCRPDQKPEVVAPGVAILSAWTGRDYVRATGTSQAVPFVTSAVALMLEGQPRPRDAEDVAVLKKAIVDNAKRIPGQDTPHDDGAGYGILQAGGAFRTYRG